MVQPKYSPEEALQRIKLMMEYKTSKTLDENKQMILEAVKTDTKNLNVLTDTDLLGDTGKIRQYFQMVSDFGGFVGLPNIFDVVGGNFANIIADRRLGVKGVVDALDGFVDSKDLAYILAVIKSLDGKCYYDDVENKSVPAIVRFIELYKEDEDEDLSSEVSGVGLRTLPTGTDKIKQKILKEIEIQQSKSCGGSDQSDKDGGKKDGGKKDGGKKSGYIPCVGGIYKYGCKTDPSGPVGVVQGCLGLSADGKFGPKTAATLKGKGITTFTDADVTKICSSTKVETPKDEFSTQVDADSVDDVLNM